MDIQSYISSGIIEQYALGTLSQEEASILECVMSNNSEVQRAVFEAQQTLSDLAVVQAIKPSDSLKQKIANQLTFSNDDDLQINDVDSDENPKKTLKSNSSGKKGSQDSNTYSTIWAMAASLLLLITLGYSIYSSNSKDAEIAELVQNRNFIQGQMEYVQKQNEILYNSDKIKLKGVENHRGLIANVYVNPSNEIYLVLENLPKAPHDKEYQLWAIVEGTPVDMGMYDQSKPEKMQSMKSVKNAQAFAITLENKGGSPTPTMEEMYVIGNVS